MKKVMLFLVVVGSFSIGGTSFGMDGLSNDANSVSSYSMSTVEVSEFDGNNGVEIYNAKDGVVVNNAVNGASNNHWKIAAAFGAGALVGAGAVAYFAVPGVSDVVNSNVGKFAEFTGSNAKKFAEFTGSNAKKFAEFTGSNAKKFAEFAGSNAEKFANFASERFNEFKILAGQKCEIAASMLADLSARGYDRFSSSITKFAETVRIEISNTKLPQIKIRFKIL